MVAPSTEGRYDYWPIVSGRQVLQARLLLGGRADANPYSVDLFVRDGADPQEWAQVAVSSGRDDLGADVTELLHHWQGEGRADRALGLVGEEDSAVDSFVRFDRPQLEITVNGVPPAPGLQGPSADARAITTTTPTLSWQPVEDPDGDPVTYTARIATGSDGNSGLMVTSPSGTATSWQVPAGVLRDGVTYYWKVFATDGRAWTPSEVRRLTVQRGLGGAATTSPTDIVGAMTTNLATGNGMLRVPERTLPSVSGGVGVDLVHNSLAPRAGLLGVYREDVDRNTEIDRTDPIRLVRTDPQLSLVWPSADGSAAAAPAPGVPGEWFSTQWIGTVTLPPGTWQFGARSDDGVRVRIDGDSVLDRWQMGAMPERPVFGDRPGVPGESSHRIEVDHFQGYGDGDAGIELWARNSDGAGAGDQVVPAAWLSSTPPGLPAGWTLQAADLSAPYTRAEVSEATVTLYDRSGAARAYTKTVGAPSGGGSGAPAVLGAGTAGYRPPPGSTDVVTAGPDGSDNLGRPTARWGPGPAADFLPDVAGNTTAIEYDPMGRVSGQRGPAGTLSSSYDNADRLTALRRDGSVLATDLAYDPAGRLTAVTFPAGGTAAGAVGNGTAGAFGYDPSGRPATATWSRTGGGVLAADVVARRAGGGVRDHVVDGTDHHPGDDYAYDGAGRLVEAWVPGRHLSYQFAVQDGCGPLAAPGADSNRTHQRIEGGPVTCYCYDHADRLVAADTETGEVRFDSHGNVTSMFGERRDHDAADRLTSVVGSDGTTLTVAYRRDARGRIVERLVDGAVVARYGYAGTSPAGMPAFTTDAAGGLLDAVVPLPGGVLMVVRATDGTATWAYPDLFGNLVAVADSSGNPLGPATTYDPFGNVVSGALPDTLTGNLDYVLLSGSPQLLEHEPPLQPTAGTYVPLLGRRM